jgi:serine/threonine protein kinase
MQKEEGLQTIGKYEVVGSLGRGSMGVVYKARDPEIGRFVAVKTLRKIGASQFQSWDQALERFKIEARSAGNLRHPNLITIFEVNRDRDTPYIVMDYVEGEGLDALIARQGKLDPQSTVSFLSQAAEGLDYAHAQGVIHRDIKPSNILVDKHGRVYILDFGVATISGTLGQSETGAGSGLVMGSPGYMSPEQILNDPTLDARSDLFALAVVAFECFTGQRPFPGENFTAVVGNILESKPLSLTLIVPELPLTLESCFERALAKKREDRFPSAREMVNAFSLALGLSAVSTAVTPVIAGKGRRRATSRWKAFRPFEGGNTLPQTTEANKRSPDDRTPLFKVKLEGSSDGKWSAQRPGDIFGSRTESLAARGAPAGRKGGLVTLILGAVFIGIGGGGLWYLFGGFSQPPQQETEQPQQPPEPPIESIVLEGPKTAPGPAGSTVVEMSDSQVLGTITSGATDARRLEALREGKRRGVAGLLEATAPLLKSDSYVLRIEAAKCLGEIGDRRAVPALLPALDDIDPVVREQTVKALAALGDRGALGYLNARLLKEDTPAVKAAIRSAISRINGF